MRSKLGDLSYSSNSLRPFRDIFAFEALEGDKNRRTLVLETRRGSASELSTKYQTMRDRPNSACHPRCRFRKGKAVTARYVIITPFADRWYIIFFQQSPSEALTVYSKTSHVASGRPSSAGIPIYRAAALKTPGRAQLRERRSCDTNNSRRPHCEHVAVSEYRALSRK